MSEQAGERLPVFPHQQMSVEEVLARSIKEIANAVDVFAALSLIEQRDLAEQALALRQIAYSQGDAAWQMTKGVRLTGRQKACRKVLQCMAGRLAAMGGKRVREEVVVTVVSVVTKGLEAAHRCLSAATGDEERERWVGAYCGAGEN